MHTILCILSGLLLLLGLAGMFFCLFLGIPIAGYFCVRVLLKVMGLYSAPPELFRKELKLAGACVALVLGSFACEFIGSLIGTWVGIIN